LSPEAAANETLRFVTFIVETLMAVYKHNGLLKASIMSATNAHRLGGNEAPPAIISSFLGTQLTELLDKIERGETSEVKGKKSMEIDIPQIPDLIIDNTDRNRTSPFAFTGNRFEFRAPGSSVNCASAMIALNAAMAEALTSVKVRVDQKTAEFALRPEYTKGTGHTAKFHAIVEVLREDITTCKPVRFDGNGYSEKWVKEAAKRGLDVEKSCPVIFEHYLDDSSVKMFESTKVMNRKELEARNEVKWEMYVKTVQIEARVLGDLAMNHIIPVSTHYQSQLIKNVQGMKDVFPSDKAERLSSRNMKLIEEIAERTEKIEQMVEELTDARRVANHIQDIHQRAIAYHDTVCPHMENIRHEIDALEMIVEDGLWTLPKYRELLFIR
jgi:glutamine synthetase